VQCLQGFEGRAGVDQSSDVADSGDGLAIAVRQGNRPTMTAFDHFPSGHLNQNWVSVHKFPSLSFL
jgi:hypothetical protein